jgi:hypothetical protein
MVLFAMFSLTQPRVVEWQWWRLWGYDLEFERGMCLEMQALDEDLSYFIASEEPRRPCPDAEKLRNELGIPVVSTQDFWQVDYEIRCEPTHVLLSVGLDGQRDTDDDIRWPDCASSQRDNA